MPRNKLLCSILTLSLGCGMLIITPAVAINRSTIAVSGDEDPSTGNTSTISVEEGSAIATSETDAAGSEPAADQPATESCEGSTDGNCLENPERYDAESSTLENGLADEPEVVCATGNEPGCEQTPDAELWPLYISLGALAATILLVIIINLIGRRKRRLRSDS